MDLMRFQRFPDILPPRRPAPPFEKAGGGLAVAYMYLPPPVGWGQKGKTSLYPP